MQIPSKCPSCGGPVTVTRLECLDCGTVLEGKFSPCPACRLDPEMRELFDLFMRSRGNLKEIQRVLQISYPTVRNRIENMFTAYEKNDAPAVGRMEILKLLRSGDITVEEAERMLRQADK